MCFSILFLSSLGKGIEEPPFFISFTHGYKNISNWSEIILTY